MDLCIEYCCKKTFPYRSRLCSGALNMRVDMYINQCPAANPTSHYQITSSLVWAGFLLDSFLAFVLPLALIVFPISIFHLFYCPYNPFVETGT